MIQVKEKPCKGITAETKGLGCGKLMPASYRVHGLGKMCGCYSDWLLNTEAGRIKLEKATLKATKPRKELEEARKEKKQRQRLPALLESTKQAVHKYIRARDKGKPCISCGTPWHSDFQAGHCYKAELYSTLKFDFDNIHGQCVKCNIRKEGNESAYHIHLPDRIGKQRYERLKKRAALDNQTSHKWEREKLLKIKTQAKTLYKYLNK